MIHDVFLVVQYGVLGLTVVVGTFLFCELKEIIELGTDGEFSSVMVGICTGADVCIFIYVLSQLYIQVKVL